MDCAKCKLISNTQLRHYPVGVLFDLFANPQELPWPITVHFQGFPTQQLLRCPNEAFVKSHYMNVLKEVPFCIYFQTSF